MTSEGYWERVDRNIRERAEALMAQVGRCDQWADRVIPRLDHEVDPAGPWMPKFQGFDPRLVGSEPDHFMPILERLLPRREPLTTEAIPPRDFMTTLNGPWCEADIEAEPDGIKIPWGPREGEILVHLDFGTNGNW